MVLQSRAESFTFTPEGRPLTIYIDEGAPSVAQCALDMFCNDYQGGGDVAVEDAIFLARGCKKVYVVHRRDELRAAKSLQEQLFALQ